MTLIRRLTIAAAVVGALVAPAVAPADGGMVGTYKTTIRDSGHLNGTWLLELDKGGRYTVFLGREALARGRYALAETTITFSHEVNSGCSGRGVYAWKRSGTTLTFAGKRESASCKARAAVLERRFTRVR